LNIKRYLPVIIAFLLVFAFNLSDVCAEQLMLREGMSGQEVLEMQTKLQSLGFIEPGNLDGIYGTVTLSAVILFLKDICWLLRIVLTFP